MLTVGPCRVPNVQLPEFVRAYQEGQGRASILAKLSFSIPSRLPWIAVGTRVTSRPPGPDFHRLDRASFLAHRYSFIVVDLHHLLLAGLPAHLCKNATAPRWRRMNIPPSVVSVVQTSRACSIAVDFGKLFLSSFDFLSFHTARVKNGSWVTSELRASSPTRSAMRSRAERD
jgi:hypothetical protein